MAPQEFRHPTRVGKWKVVGGSEIIASTNSGNIHTSFLNRPPQERRSEVAIVKCPVYGLAEGSVREAIALLGGGEGEPPAVRAQAILPVRVPCGRLLGLCDGYYYVSACVTAMYVCETQRPRLIRVDRFICPFPGP